jgi:hypothetical protein
MIMKFVISGNFQDMNLYSNTFTYSLGNQHISISSFWFHVAQVRARNILRTSIDFEPEPSSDLFVYLQLGLYEKGSESFGMLLLLKSTNTRLSTASLSNSSVDPLHEPIQVYKVFCIEEKVTMV